MEKHSESKDHHNSRWIPSTPAKVVSDKLEPIAEKQVQLQPSQAIWSHGQSCQRNTSENETTASNAVTNSISHPPKSQCCGDIRNVFSEFKDVPLQDLLGQLIAGATFSASKQISLNDKTGASATKSSALQHDFESRIHFVPDTPQRVTSHFEPVTPEHSNIIDKINVSTPANLGVATEMHKEDVKSFDIQNNQSEFVVNKSLGSLSPVMGENLESGKATEQQIDMTKTLVKKQRKRKHRPKVIVEGQTKNSRNQRTPKPTLQEVTTPKRKYVRKSKPADVVLDDKANGAAQGAKLQGSEVTPKIKRKYVRRKKVDQPTTPSEDGNTTTDTRTAQATRRSCRKSLNFGIESQAPKGSSREMHSDPDIEYVQEKEGSILNDDPLIKESQVPCSPTSCMSSRGKCEIVFSNVTHDKEVSTSKTMASQVKRVTKRSNSKRSSNASLSPETQARKSKRRRLSTTDALEPCNINAAGAHYNSMQAYQEIIPPYEYSRGEIPNMHFPAIFKKRRSEASHKSASSSILLTSITTDYNNRYCTYPANDLTILDPAAFEINKNASKCLQTLGDAKKLTKKRFQGVNRVWDLDSPLESSRQLPAASSNGTGNSEDLYGPFVCMEALAEIHATVATKKRSNKFVVSSACLAKSIGSMILKDTAAVDSIAEKFGCPGAEEQNALIPYQADHQCQNRGAIVPVKDQIRKPRPKVELDNETDRVWRLLLEDINSEGINGTDEQKAKWWDEERKVFRLRTESFIARMHLVQGDRRFTPWKGSVLDSVIGVFLTQNVSDHLSSSAFISMAARFPLKLGNDQYNTYLCKERLAVSRVLNPADTLECHRKVSSPPAEIHSSMTLSNEEEINTGVSLGNKYEDPTTIIHPISLSLYDSECLQKLYNEPDLNKFGSQQNKILASFNGDQRELGEGIYSLNSVVSPHNSADSIGQCSRSSTEAEPTGWAYGRTSFVELLQMAGTVSHGVYRQRFGMQSYFGNPAKSGGIPYNLQSVGSGYQEIDTFKDSRFFEIYKENERSVNEQSGLSPESSAGTSSQNTVASSFEELQKLPSKNSLSEIELVPKVENQENPRICEGSNDPRSSQGDLDNLGKNLTRERARKQKAVETNKIDGGYSDPGTAKVKGKTNRKEKKEAVDWDELRKQAQAHGRRERTLETMDSVDWEAVRCADVKDIADAIKDRGMNNVLGERIKDFLNRMVSEHGEIDLEWLRDVAPDRAKEYLLSVRGLGLKSVECVRLLTLHHLAFPVDTNVGRIAVRLGWVPLQPLPESLQLHLLEMYPVLESIQKYLWPRLCKLDQRTLYELHYQMITFGKVFCTKSKPNCNACPMRAECRHFASAYASARLPLPAPEEKSIVRATENLSANRHSPSENINRMQLTQPEANQLSGASYQLRTLGPIVEEPKTPEPENTQVPEIDIEDTFEDDNEIPRIKLNLEELKETITNIVQHKVQEGEISKALMVLDAETASIPMPKLKSINRLRTEHRVYELPDSHPLLQGFERREPDDPSPYLLAIWTPGETVNSIQPPESTCSFQETGKLCDQETCFSCNSKREADTQTVRGTVLIPCRTAMRGSFPLNGTYFQVNEMFADHESSLNPIDVPREWLWNLPRRMVYFGTSIPTIFKGLSQPEIQYCFWKGFVCVRGFDKKTRAPRPLVARLHFPASKLNRTRTRGRTNE